MDLKTKLEQLCEPALKDLGFLLIQIHMSGAHHVMLQITIERADLEPMSMNDCVKASRELSALLDVEDPIEAAYTLEVSSPGDDRPLVKPQDFVRFIGEQIKFETSMMIDGCKRFKGQLIAANETEFTVRTATQEAVVIAYNQLFKARLNPIQPELQTKKRRS